MIHRLSKFTLFPYTTLFRSANSCGILSAIHEQSADINQGVDKSNKEEQGAGDQGTLLDRKSTRLNSSHVKISYAVFCLKKKILLTTASITIRQIIRKYSQK